jgi:hypothetical protein
MSGDVGHGWLLVGVVFEGEAICVDGINPWLFKWRNVEREVELEDPVYGRQYHKLTVWQVDTEIGSVTFAAGEVSNCVWCFYTPDPATAVEITK